MRRILFAALFIAACTGDVTHPAMLGLSFSVVSGDGQTGTVGTALAQPLVIKATDSKGRAIRNLAVEFRVTSGGGSANPSTATTNNQGVAQTSWTLGTSSTVSQQLEARGVSSGQVFGSFMATALAGPATGLVKVAGDSQTAPRLSAVPIRPAVRVVDQYGNPVPGTSIQFSIVTGGGTVTSSPVSSGSDGIASVQWTLGSTVGAQHLSAVLPATAIVPFMATATLGAGAHMAIYAGNNQVTTVNVAFPVGPAVRITDASGNPIEGVRPTYTFVQGGGSLSGGSDASRADGVYDYSTWIPCCTRGTYIVRVTAAGIPDTVSFSSVAESGPAKTIAVQAGNGQTASTNTPVLVAPAAIVRDTFGNPVPRVAIEFAVTAGGGSVIGSSATTDTNGVAAVTRWVLGPAAGTNALTATASGVGSVTFTATGVVPLLDPSRSTVGLSPSSIVASAGDITSTVTFTARDANGSPIVGATVTLTVSGTGNSITQPTAVTDSNGATTGAVSSSVAQYKNVSGVINGRASWAATLEVRAGPPVSMVAYAGDNQVASVGTPVPSKPQVLVRDQFGNGSHGTIVTWEVETGGGSMGSIESPGVFPSGIATSGVWTLGSVAGSNALRASIAGTVLEATFYATGDPSFWTNRAAIPTPRFLLGAAVANDRVYAVGGSDVTEMAAVEAYDPSTDTWSMRAPLPTARGELGVAAVNNVLYAMGGVSNQSVVGTVEAYDPGTDSWISKAPMPTPRADFAVAVVNGVIYAIGGSTGIGGEVGTVEAYDPATDTWVTKAAMPTPRMLFGAAEAGGIIYAVGGWNNQGVWIPTVEAYDPASNTWTTKASLPTPRFGLGVAAIDGRVYALGGYMAVDNYATLTPVLEAFDPVSNAWTAKPAMLEGRVYLATAVSQGVLYVVGGEGATSLQVYHP